MTASARDLRLEDIGHVFGAVRALSRVSATLRGGDVVAVMGPNGAGKSTLLSILSGARSPTAGALHASGAPVARDLQAWRDQQGFLGHDTGLYGDLTARENLAFYRDLHAGHPGIGAAPLDDLSARFGLADFWDAQPVRQLSRGQLQRTALAKSLLTSPWLWLLDEPTAGLDLAHAALLACALTQHRAQDGIAVVATHEPAFAAAVATRLWVLHRGRLALDAPCPADETQLRAQLQDACAGGVS
ncbi:MAG: heme ABC exporter ATP-binding protein CcmA [Myxococcales bacterium]|nr:heme ABC exporter ATP-binding protein CcmA [Myxococcales bacterium]